MYTPIQWLQSVIKNCAQYLPLEDSNHVSNADDVSQLQYAYSTFTQQDKDFIRHFILNDLEADAPYGPLLILSYLQNILKINDFNKDIAHTIYAGNFDCHTQVMLEIQLVFLSNIPYDILRRIHRKSLSCLLGHMEFPFPYIPVKSRTNNKIIIFTEQLLLNNRHAPTLMTLETAYTLHKYFHYDIELFTCTSNRLIPSYLWISTQGMNFNGDKNMQIPYKDTILSARQYPLASCSLKDYEQMLHHIYRQNPLFVLNIGVNSPIADLPRIFTTVVNLNTVTKAPISEADIFIRCMKLDSNLETLYQNELSPHQAQIFMQQNFPAVYLSTGEHYTRETLHLPTQQFLICLVGNRLDGEISPVFLQFMLDILQNNSKIDFVIIGNTTELNKHFENTPFDHRIHYLGYCPDLMAVYPALDLYLNPERVGGGWSSAIALRAGLPVVTLPNCDVAYNVSEDFIVHTKEDMRKTIFHYATDASFLKAQRQLALTYATELGENKIIDFISEMLTKIKETMSND